MVNDSTKKWLVRVGATIGLLGALTIVVDTIAGASISDSFKGRSEPERAMLENAIPGSINDLSLHDRLTAKTIFATDKNRLDGTVKGLLEVYNKQCSAGNFRGMMQAIGKAQTDPTVDARSDLNAWQKTLTKAAVSKALYAQCPESAEEDRD